MLFVRKINFSKEEVDLMMRDLDGYVWLVMDIRKGVVAAGDEFVVKMKTALLRQKCSVYDIFGVGFDLLAGEIDYYSPVNKKFIDKGSTREVPEEKRERIETLVKYFFMELPAFSSEQMQPRYSKKIMINFGQRALR